MLIFAMGMRFLLKSVVVACLYGLWKGKKKSEDCNKKTMLIFEREKISL